MKILFHLIDIFGLIQVHSYLNQFHFAYGFQASAFIGNLRLSAAAGKRQAG